MPKRVVGTVTRDKAAKNRRVEIDRLVRHPQYGKLIKRKTICYAHDEENVSKNEDTVEIEEASPKSKLKRWKLVKVVVKGREDAGQTIDEPPV